LRPSQLVASPSIRAGRTPARPR